MTEEAIQLVKDIAIAAIAVIVTFALARYIIVSTIYSFWSKRINRLTIEKLSLQQRKKHLKRLIDEYGLFANLDN